MKKLLADLLLVLAVLLFAAVILYEYGEEIRFIGCVVYAKLAG